MSNHFENLRRHLPNLGSMSILDVGSGRGKFLAAAAKAGARVEGVEPYEKYIELSQERAKRDGVIIRVRKGDAEHLPFDDETFDFLNLSEVIEHVESPEKVLLEVKRVLKPGGHAYVSVPNRFGFFDQHFHLPFLNWMPRSWAERLVGILGKHKDYSLRNGRQRISEMYYDTFEGASTLFKKSGFSLHDLRGMRLKQAHLSFLLPIYFVFRVFLWDSFHFLIEKNAEEN